MRNKKVNHQGEQYFFQKGSDNLKSPEITLTMRSRTALPIEAKPSKSHVKIRNDLD